MTFDIIWSPQALEDYFQNIEYLELKWSNKEVRNFIEATDAAISIISKSPNTFRFADYNDVRQVPIMPQITLFYRANSHSVQLIRFWNNYQNPESRTLETETV